MRCNVDALLAIQQRYSCKCFDANYILNEQQMEEIQSLLLLAPSSMNVQPWSFVLVQTIQAKQKLFCAGTNDYSRNIERMKNASLCVVFSSKIRLEEEAVYEVFNQEVKDDRYTNEDVQVHLDRMEYLRKIDEKEGCFSQWCENQLYLNVGHFVASLSVMGLDSLIVEGLDMSIVDDVFSLKAQGYKACLVVCVGKHSAQDPNKICNKSRLKKKSRINKQ